MRGPPRGDRGTKYIYINPEIITGGKSITVYIFQRRGINLVFRNKNNRKDENNGHNILKTATRRKKMEKEKKRE
jgi:hypothetical protein